jgi:hypothetical protein
MIYNTTHNYPEILMNTVFKQIGANILLIALFISFTSQSMYKGSAHQLNTMEPKPMESDLQLYQFLSVGIENDSPFKLPIELVQIIAINMHTITELRCFEKYGACLDSVKSLLTFIQERAYADMNINTTVNILKVCLSYSNKLLSTICAANKNTALHGIINAVDGFGDREKSYYCLDVLCQAAGNDSINLLFAQNSIGFTVLHWATLNAHNSMVEKLLCIADDKKLELTSIKSHSGLTALVVAERLHRKICI